MSHLPISDPDILCQDVTVRFPGHTALDGINLTLSGRGVVGLIGVNGAGKTTLINTILGITQPTSGRVRVNAAGARSALCTDVPSFEPSFTADEVLRQSVLLSDGRKAVPSRDERILVLDRVGLADAADRKTGGFSRGMRQRLGIAAGIVSGPPIIFLDEPTSALDPLGRQMILDIIRELGREMLVVVSSHILDDVESVASSLVVIHEGKLRFVGTLQDFLSPVRDHEDSVVIRFSGGWDELREDLIGCAYRFEDDGSLVLPSSGLATALKYFARNPGDLESVSLSRPGLAQAFFASVEAQYVLA